MNRQTKREMERQRKRDSKRDRRADYASLQESKKHQRATPAQFLSEVRGELRKVAWPSRAELVSYSLVVLVSVTLLTLTVFALDQVFGTLVLWIFG